MTIKKMILDCNGPDRYTMRGPNQERYILGNIGCLWNLCKNDYTCCRMSSDRLFGPNKNRLQGFHRCFTGNSKYLPCSEYLKVYVSGPLETKIHL